MPPWKKEMWTHQRRNTMALFPLVGALHSCTRLPLSQPGTQYGLGGQTVSQVALCPSSRLPQLWPWHYRQAAAHRHGRHRLRLPLSPLSRLHLSSLTCGGGLGARSPAASPAWQGGHRSPCHSTPTALFPYPPLHRLPSSVPPPPPQLAPSWCLPCRVSGRCHTCRLSPLQR